MIQNLHQKQWNYLLLKQINKHLLPGNQIFDLDSHNPRIQNLINNLK